MKTNLLAVLLLAAGPASAEDAAPPIGQATAINPLTPADDAAIARLASRFQVSSIRIEGDGPFGFDVAGFVANLQKAMDDAAKAAAKAADLPTKEELEKLSIELPFTFPTEAEVKDHDLLILYDKTGKGPRASWHEPQWAVQAGMVKDKLMALGAPEERITVAPIAKKEDFLAMLKAHPGKKKLFLFGHASPLTIHFGDEDVPLKENSQALQDAKVDMICHYGCNFINVDEEGFKPFQATFGEGRRITLFGHHKASTKDDDTPFDKDNPIRRCDVAKDCARLYDPAREATARIAGLTQRLVKTVPGVQTGLPQLDALAAYDGEKPYRVHEPSLIDYFIPAAQLLIKRATSAVPPPPPGGSPAPPGGVMDPSTWTSGVGAWLDAVQQAAKKQAVPPPAR
ncbi:MAG: hypothetical protein HYZ75_02300 [Elusimicrobia bacterium]|nr:hypothetical protein [Elusimicrobiota bacterium]